MITDEEGKSLYMVSRGTNQFLQNRELPLYCISHRNKKYHNRTFTRKVTSISIPGLNIIRKFSNVRFSFGPGEWRDGPVAWREPFDYHYIISYCQLKDAKGK